jgi:flagellar hook-length control protein FliK
MTNLPITSNAHPPAAHNAAGAATGTAAEEGQFAGPFAALLARQIGNADTALLNLAQISIAPAETGSGTAADAKDIQDPAAVIADTGAASPDAANSVMAMLLQIPQEPRTAAADDTAAGDALPSIGKSDTAKTGSSLAASDASPHSRNDAPQELPAAASAKAAGMTGKTEVTAALGSQQAVPEIQSPRPFELPAAGDTLQPASAGATHLASPALSSVMPHPQANSKAGENPQAVNTPLGAKGWSDEFSQKISWMSTQQNQVAELHLNPPDLGPLDVVLKITDNQATALFTSPHGAVREAVESALPRLREALADNGITLGNATVSDQPPRERDAEGSRGQGNGASNQRDSGTAEAGSVATASAQQGAARRHNGMVDTFA